MSVHVNMKVSSANGYLQAAAANFFNPNTVPQVETIVCFFFQHLNKIK